MLKILKNKANYMIIAGITVLALLLRIIGLDKPSGLWYDELITYNFSLHGFPYTNIRTYLWQFLYNYPFFLWQKVFGSSDIMLRGFSVIFGILTIPAIYMAGKELDKIIKNPSQNGINKVAIVATSIAALNSLFIYYSQEVRHYSLFFFISTLSALFMIKLLTKPIKRNYICYLGVCFLLVEVNLWGTLFIFFQFLSVIAYFYFNNREEFNKLKKYLPVVVIMPVLAAVYMIYAVLIPSSFIISPFDHFIFDSQVIFIFLQNWFSPVLTSLWVNAPNYFTALFLVKFTLQKLIFICLPVIFSLICIIKANITVKKEFNIVNALFLSAIFYLAIQIVISLSGIYVVVTRYTIIILPFLILILSYGLCRFNKRIFIFILSYIISINLFFILASPHSAPKLDRLDGVKPLSTALNSLPLDKNDIVIFPMDYFDTRYLTKKFIKLNIQGLFINNINVRLFVGKESADKVNQHNSKEFFRNYLNSRNYGKNFENYMANSVFKSLKSGDYFVYVDDRQTTRYNRDFIKLLVNNKSLYKEVSLYTLLFSRISIDMLDIAAVYLKPVKVISGRNFKIYVFQKR